MTRTVFVEFLHRPNALFARVALGVVFFCLAWVGSQASSNFSSHQRSGQTSLQAAPAAIVYLLMKGMKSAQFDSHIQYDVIVSWASSTGLAEELFQFTGSTQVGNDLKVTMQINAVSLQEADNALNLVLASPSAAVDIMSTLSGINNAFTVTGYKLVTISGKDSPYVPATTPEPPLVCDSSCATCTDSTPTGCSLCPFGSYQFQDSSGTKCVGLWSLQGILGMTIGTTVMLVALLVLAYVCFNGLDLAVVYSKRRGRLRNVAWQPRRAYDPGRDLAGLPTAVGAAAKM